MGCRQGIIATLEAIGKKGEYSQTGKKPATTQGKKGNAKQNLHKIPEGLKTRNKFVMKAIEGGWNINSLKNLTPVERFLKKNNSGRHAKHTKYTKKIDDYLTSQDLSSFTANEAGDFLDQLGDHIEQRIKNTKGKLNDLDLQLDKFQYKKKK